MKERLTLKKNKAPDTSHEPVTNGAAAVISDYAPLDLVPQGLTVYSEFRTIRFHAHYTEQAYAEIVM